MLSVGPNGDAGLPGSVFSVAKWREPRQMDSFVAVLLRLRFRSGKSETEKEALQLQRESCHCQVQLCAKPDYGVALDHRRVPRVLWLHRDRW
jgi:hypothetical protein